MNGLYRLMSGIYHITGRRRKGKGLEVPCKCNYYDGPTKDLALIFVTMLFPPTTKLDQVFIQDRL